MPSPLSSGICMAFWPLSKLTDVIVVPLLWFSRAAAAPRDGQADRQAGRQAGR